MGKFTKLRVLESFGTLTVPEDLQDPKLIADFKKMSESFSFKIHWKLMQTE